MDKPEAFPTLRSAFPSGAAFLSGFQPGEEVGSFLHGIAAGADLPEWAQPHTLVSVILEFLDRAAEFHVHGSVLERIAEGEGRGLRIAFLAEEKDRQELVLACAEGESLPYFRRRHQRIPCKLPVQLTGPEGQRVDTTASRVSEGGAWLALAEQLEVGSVIQLLIAFGALHLPIRGRVSSQVRSGPDHGVGVEFLFESTEQKRLLEGCVQALREEPPG